MIYIRIQYLRMNFKSQGLFIAIIILICMILVCHTVNFLYSNKHKNKSSHNKASHNKNLNSFANMVLEIPNNTIPIEYNQIYYDYSNKNKKEECKLKNEAEIPCNIVSSCDKKPIPTPIPTTTQYQLSESEMALLYRDAYASAGRQLLLNVLNE